MSEYVVNYEIYADGILRKWGTSATTVTGPCSAKDFVQSVRQNAAVNAGMEPAVDWQDIRIIGVFKL